MKFCIYILKISYHANSGSPPARMASTSSTSLSVAAAICSAVKPFLCILFTITAIPLASPTAIPLPPTEANQIFPGKPKPGYAIFFLIHTYPDGIHTFDCIIVGTGKIPFLFG